MLLYIIYDILTDTFKKKNPKQNINQNSKHNSPSKYMTTMLVFIG